MSLFFAVSVERHIFSTSSWSGMSGPGITPRLSFRETVMSTGTLFQRPLSMSVWMSSGTMSPSTTA